MQLKIEIRSIIHMPANGVRMYHIKTGECKYYSEIDPQDIDNWILWDRECFEYKADEHITITPYEDDES